MRIICGSVESNINFMCRTFDMNRMQCSHFPFVTLCWIMAMLGIMPRPHGAPLWRCWATKTCPDVSLQTQNGVDIVHGLNCSQHLIDQGVPEIIAFEQGMLTLNGVHTKISQIIN